MFLLVPKFEACGLIIIFNATAKDSNGEKSLLEALMINVARS